MFLLNMRICKCKSIALKVKGILSAIDKIWPAVLSYRSLRACLPSMLACALASNCLCMPNHHVLSQHKTGSELSTNVFPTSTL